MAKSKSITLDVDVKEEEMVDDPLLPNKSLFRVAEVAAYLHVGRATVYLWIDHGILLAEKYGATIRVSRDAILACRFRSRVNPLA